jgi:transcriptional regulator with XRE-family HTH domain
LSRSLGYAIVKEGFPVTSPSRIRMVIRRVVNESGLTQAQLAEDAGLSYAGIRAWLKGEREPQTESRKKLAAGLRKRAARLEELAREVDREVGE